MSTVASRPKRQAPTPPGMFALAIVVIFQSIRSGAVEDLLAEARRAGKRTVKIKDVERALDTPWPYEPIEWE